MRSSNIGARKDRNILDHLFVLNSILQEVSENKKNIDIGLYDVMKCFDKMWSSETANDMFKAGLNDDTFVLVANSNKECQVAVKTPWGSLTERRTLENIEMQGGVLTPLKCSVQIDSLGKETMANIECSRSMYYYKESVKIPPLAFCDDILSISECGPSSITIMLTFKVRLTPKSSNLVTQSVKKYTLEIWRKVVQPLKCMRKKCSLQ